MSALDAWEAWLMLTCLLLIAVWAVSVVVKWVRDRRRWRQIVGIEPRCERAGSQAEFERRMRAGGAR